MSSLQDVGVKQILVFCYRETV